MKNFFNKAKDFINMGGNSEPDDYEYMDDEYEEDDEEEEKPVVAPKAATTQAFTPNQNTSYATRVRKDEMKVIFVEPKSFEEAKAIVRNLNDNRPVIVNLENTDQHEAYRITDFLSGATYAINGDLGKVGTNIFFCSPPSVKVDYNQKTYVEAAGEAAAFPTFKENNEL